MLRIRYLLVPWEGYFLIAQKTCLRLRHPFFILTTEVNQAAMAILQRIRGALRTEESVFQENQDGKYGEMRILTQLRMFSTYGERCNTTAVTNTSSRKSQRVWKHWNFFAFFWAVSFNPNQWNTGSSLVNQGLVSVPFPDEIHGIEI